MLVLTRALKPKHAEPDDRNLLDIECPDGTIITVLTVANDAKHNGAQIKLGINAPTNYKIRRRDAIKGEPK